MDKLKKSGLTLSVLGPFQAALDRGPLPKLATVRAQALLVYLAVEDVLGQRAQRRETLTELLWPGMPPGSGRKNLRQTLYYLRQAVPDRTGDEGSEIPFLIADRYQVEINPGFPLWLDVAEFLHLLDGPQEDWPQALDLYRGDFLSGFSLEDSSELEGWILARRAYLQRQALDVLSTLTGEAIGRRAFDRARDYAERQLELDNLRESAHRQLMELLALDGRREEALAQYQTCRRLLQEELGMAPSARTTALYERIRAGDRALDAHLVQSARGYELKELIGQGAFGAVHRAIQPAVNREVAVKVIRRQYADDPAFIRRFDAEAQTVARLEHPHIVPLYDYWRDPDGAYLVMRYLRGGSLASGLEKRPWEPEQTARMLEQVAQALAAAHAQGVVHRDIKPANILFDQEGNAYLADFGIAKERDVHRSLTAAGAIVGTPAYISPEQILDKKVVPQSDLYSLGAVLFETLTGEKPFQDSSVANLIHKQLHEPFPLINVVRPDLPPQIDAVIQRATAKRPGDRYASALELAEAFRLALLGREPSRSTAVSRPAEVANPYKGLRPFQEADADDFFGRQVLIQGLLARLAHSPFLAVVGPSGSGKSSVVKAGLIPALRGSALPGSEKWFVAQMVPGAYPLEELEKALWPVAVDPPPSLVEPMGRDGRGILRTLGRILPPEEEAVLLLVIDQFEELFTLVDDPWRRDRFVDGLLTALAEPNSPLRVVVTLRADFYDRPLQTQELGQWLKKNTEVVLPLSPEELTATISQPAARVGVTLEDGLVPAIVADVQNEPGALPLLQYALTELFDRRQDGHMRLEAYREIGGVTGALARRAEELYAGLDEVSQEVARQLFLRLVTLGEGVEDTRRRVLRQELEELLTVNGEQLIVNDRPEEAHSPFIIHHSPLNMVLDTFSRYRLLTFDRDPVTRGPTVEVAHEALLRQWPRLRGWLDEGREDIRLQRSLASAAAEWRAGGREEGYLLHGARLSQFESWAAATGLALTGEERAYLEASLAAREGREAAQAAQQAREEALEARSRDRLRYLVGVLATATVVAVILVIFAFGQRRTAQQQRDNAREEAEARATQQAIAEEEASARATQQVVAERSAAESQSLALASAAQAALGDGDAEQALALAYTANQIDAPPAFSQRMLYEAALAPGTIRRYIGGEIFRWPVVVDPTGQIIASGNDAGIITFWDIESGEELTRLEDPLGSIIGDISYAPDGDTMLAGTFDDTLILWDTISGQVIWRVDNPTGDVNNVDISPDGQLAIAGTQFGVATLWDMEMGEFIGELAGHDPALQIQGVAFSPDGRLAATASEDSTAIIWDVKERTIRHRLEGHTDKVFPVAFSPDGTVMATGSFDRSIILWSVISGQALAQLTGHSDFVFGLAFNSDGSQLLSSSRDQTLILWDVNRRMPIHTYSGDGRQLGLALVDDERAVSVVSTGDLRLWALSDGQTTREFHPDEAPITSMVLTKDRRVAVLGMEGQILVLDLESGVVRDRWTVDIHDTSSMITDGALNPVVLHPENSWLLSGHEDGSVHLWDLADHQELNLYLGHDLGIQGLAFSPDGKKFLSSSGDRTLLLRDLDTGAIEQRFESPTDTINAVAFSPDGSTFAAGFGTYRYFIEGDYEDNRIHLWDAASGDEIRQFEGHEGPVVSLRFSHDGRRLLSGSIDNTVRLWDTTTGQELRRFDGHTGGVFSVNFSPDETYVTSGSVDATIIIWDAATGDLLRRLTGHTGAVSGVAFGLDNNILWSAASDGAVRSWAPLLELDKLLVWIQANRYLPELSCAQRELYRVEPFCE